MLKFILSEPPEVQRLRAAFAESQKQLADAKSLLSTEKEVREATDSSLFNLAAYVSHESNYNMPMSGHAISARNCIKQLRKQLAESEASAAALRAALEPLAEQCKPYTESCDDRVISLELRYLRRAAAALAEKGGE